MNIWPPPLAERLHLPPFERVKGGGAHGDADDLDAGRKEEIIVWGLACEREKV